MSDIQQEQKINTTDLIVTAEPEFQQYDLNRQSIYVNCNLRAPPPIEEAKRTPIEVAVVLDRSGSMAGERLRLCIKTMEFLVQELTAADRLAILTYDDVVKTECRLTRMDATGKEQVASIINSIHSGGMTNLSGGLMEGIQEIQSETRIDGQPPNEVKSILLLTDGHANVGITQTEGLVDMIKGCLQPHVSLFTFGYGSNHNETMLRTISDVGGGVYYFVENIDGVTLAFADCLGGLLSVAAQNIKIDVNISPKSEVKITSLKTKKSITTLTEGKRYEIQMGDMYAEEERDVLIVLDLPTAMTDSALSSIVEFHVTYANVLTSKFEKVDATVQIERVMSVPDTCIANGHIQKQKVRIQSAEAVEAAKAWAEKGDFTNAQATMAAAVEEVTLAMETAGVKDKGYVTKLWSDLKKSEANVVNKNVYAARGRHQMTSQMQSNYLQRCNSIDIEEDELDDQISASSAATFDSSAPPPQNAGGYRNASKAKMMKKAFNFMKK